MGIHFVFGFGDHGPVFQRRKRHAKEGVGPISSGPFWSSRGSDKTRSKNLEFLRCRF